MEEKYSIAEKKFYIEQYIKMRSRKTYVTHTLGPLKLHTSRTHCIHCGLQSKGQMFCSLVCNDIFRSNHKLFNDNSVVFVPFEILTESSKDIYRSIVLKYKSVDYNGVKIFSHQKTIGEERHVILDLTFTKDLMIVARECLDLVMAQLYKKSETFTEPCLEPWEDNNLLKKTCIFCDEVPNDREISFIRIDEDFIIGGACSLFCFKGFLAYAEKHLNLKYKSFIDVPHPILLDNKKQLKILHTSINDGTIINTQYTPTGAVINVINYN